MTRDNRQILVNPHSSQEKIPAGVLNLGEIAVQHNNIEDAALYVETVADSQSAGTVAKFITEKAIDNKIDDAISVIVNDLQNEIDGINEAVGLPHDPELWNSGMSVWDAIEHTYEEMTAGTAAANTKLELLGGEDDYLALTSRRDDTTSSITYYLASQNISEAIASAYTILDEKIEANEVESSDGSIVITTGANGTDLSVNIDNHSIVLNDNNELVADLKLSAITPSASNVKEEYALINHDGTQLGDSVKIYKDSSLYRVYLGHVDDALTSPSDPTVIDGSGDTALCFIYEKTDGTYELVAIDVEEFLEESEFADGLQVNNHVVSVLVDPTSEEVVVDASGNTAPVLTVGPDGIKIDNIAKAIDVVADELEEKIDELAEELGEVSVSEGTSFENYVKLNITNDGNGATAITIDDTELKQLLDYINDDIANEIAARETADEEIIGSESGSTSADTSLWGIKKLLGQITTTLVKDVTVGTGETLLDVTRFEDPDGDLYLIESTQRLNDAVELAETSVQEVAFAAVSEKDETAYGSNAGAEIVDGEDGKKINLDLSTLKIDCGSY